MRLQVGFETQAVHAEKAAYANTLADANTLLEKRMSVLEGGVEAVAFPTGLSALSALVLSFAQMGDEVIVSRALRRESLHFFQQVLPRYGVQTHFCDLTQPKSIQTLITSRTRLVFLETPCFPDLAAVDISLITSYIRATGFDIPVVADNTCATPCLQKPIPQGAFAVLYASPAFLAGNVDTEGGLVVASDPDYARMLREEIRDAFCGKPAAYNGHFFLRGLETLQSRMQKQAATALTIAQFMDGHKKIKAILYPGLYNFPQREIVRRQMEHGGSLLAFELHDDAAHAQRLLEHLDICQKSTIAGTSQTTIEHPASMSYADVEDRPFSDSLLRLSVGLENTDDLLADLDRALFRI